MPHPPASPQPSRDFLRTLREFSDRRFLLSGLAVIVLGVIETGGLVLVLPMLQAVGIESEVADGRLGRFLSTLHDWGLPRSLAGLLLFFLVLAVIQTLAKTTLARLTSRISADFVFFLRERLHRALVAADWSVFLRQRSSDIVRALTNESARAGHGALLVIQLASSSLQTAAQIAVAWLVSPSVTVVSLLAGIVVLFLVRPFSRRARRTSEDSQVDRGALAAAITDHVNGLKLAKSHGVEERCAKTFAEISRNLAKQQVHIAVDQSRASAGFNLGASVALVGFVWFAAEVQQVQGAEIAVLGVIFMRLASRMMSIQSLTQQFALMLPSFTACESLRQQWLRATPAVSSTTASSTLQLRHGLVLNRVGFTYPESHDTTLREVDLDIPAGRTTALCGASGAGKSTLADCCLGLLTPQTGRLVVDGVPLTVEVLPAWRANVAYVPQDVFLFNDTLRHNLTFLAPDSDEDAVWAALESASARNMVAALPDGLDTVVGDRGIRLSGGERQRIALARALLRKPRFLVLDEATSSLDNANERAVQQAIDRLHGTMTILIIAHRLSTIRHADQIAVMDAGRVVQSGTWEELSANTDGPFARMVADAAI